MTVETPASDPLVLFHENEAWVDDIAWALIRKVPVTFEHADLAQAGKLECWRRAQIWDPKRNGSFQGYAYWHVKGAMLALLRRSAWQWATKSEELGERDFVDIREEYQEGEPELARRAWLEAAIARLEPAEAYIARRLYLDAIPREDLAKLWGVPVSEITRVSVRVMRLLKRARKESA